MGYTGNFLSGAVRGFSAARQSEQDRAAKKEAQKLQQQAMKLQMEGLKLKQQEQQFKQTFLENALTGRPFKMPDMAGQPSEPKFSPTFGGGDMAGAMPSVGTGTIQEQPQGVADLIVQMQGNPMAAYALKELIGIDFPGMMKDSEARRHNQVIEGQGDQRIKQGQEQFYATREDKKQEVTWLEQTGEDGTKVKVPYNRFGQQVGGPQMFMSEPAPVETFEYEQNGVKYSVVRNKRTGQPMTNPVPIEAPKPGSTDTAGKLSLSANAQKMLPKIRGLIFTESGDLDKKTLAGASSPFGGIGDKGRQLKSVFMDALDARIRAATGAAVTKDEWPAYFTMYLPSPFDSKVLAEDKLNRLEQFLSGYVTTLDPSGAQRGRIGSNASSNKTGVAADKFYNVKTGRLETVK